MLIDSSAQSLLISKSFSFLNHFPEISLKKPILIHSIDGKPLSNRFISHTVLTNCCIQEHTKYKTCGIVEMNCDLVLGIDWLQQHNPSIDWESNEISFSCCSMNSVIPKLGDTLTLNEFPLENSDVGHSSIQILLVLVEEFFNQDWISLFGMIKFIPNSIEIAVSASGPAFEGSSPVPIPGSLEYIKSKVPEKYHAFINIFVEKEASTLPPHWDQDIKIELEEGSPSLWSNLFIDSN